MSNQRGFTLIEVIITATLVAIAASAIVGLFVVIGGLNRQSRDLAIATQQLQIKLESYRNQTYNAIPTGSPAETFTAALPTDLDTPRSAIVNVTESPVGLKLVDIQISYTEGNATKKVQAQTYISQHGVGR